MFAELWPKVAAGAGEDGWGGGNCEVLWGVWPGKALGCLLSRRKSKEMLTVMPESVGWDKGGSQEGES